MKIFYKILIALFLCPLISHAGTVADIKKSCVQYQNRTLDYVYYIPKNLSRPSPVVVLVHGMNGRGEYMLSQNWISFADETGYPILAPTFVFEGSEAFKNETSFQYPAAWSGRALNTALKDLKTKGVSPSGLYLMGFSAGSQFVGRYTLLWPKYVKKCAIIGSGGEFNVKSHINTQFFYGIGGKDESHRQHWASDFKSKANKYKLSLKYQVYPNLGHTFTPEIERDVIQFFRIK